MYDEVQECVFHRQLLEAVLDGKVARLIEVSCGMGSKVKHDAAERV